MSKVRTLFLASCTVCFIVSMTITGVAYAQDAKSFTASGIGHRFISPSGDILDSGMDALAALQSFPFDLKDEGISAKTFENHDQAVTALNKALYLPADGKEIAKLTSERIHKIDFNQKKVLNQISAHVTTFGRKSDTNVDNFDLRRQRAMDFIQDAQNIREDTQVLTGVTLGMVAETNKMIGLTTNRMILKAADNLSSIGLTSTKVN